MATLALARPVQAGSIQLLLIAGPAALLLGALGFQYLGGLHPCELCLWQRWPHLAAFVLALGAVARPQARRPLLALAAIAVLTSAGIAMLHVGVEQHWWIGPTACSSYAHVGGGDFMAAMMAAPIIRCDAAAWAMLGISMAGWNAIASTAIGIGALQMLARGR